MNLSRITSRRSFALLTILCLGSFFMGSPNVAIAATHVSAVTVGAQTGTLTYGTAASATYNVTISGQGAGGLTVTPTVSGLPAGVTYSFNPVSVTVNNNTSQSTTLTLTTSASTAATTGATFTVNASGETNTGSLVVGKRVIGVTADAATKVYGDADPTLTYQITSGSLVGGDSFSGTLSRAAGENVGTYAITVGSLSAGSNYTVAFTSANVNITARPITVTAASDSKVYDATINSSATPVITGTLATGDTPNFTQTFDTATVGSGKTLTAAGIVNDSNGGNNYAVTFVTDTTGEITAKDITVTADALSKTYGDSDPTLSYGVTGTLLGGDSFSGSLSRDAGDDVGDYAITQGTLALPSNYNLIFVGSTFTITPKSVLTVTANDQAITYGSNDPEFTFTYDGFVNDDTESDVDTAPTCSVSGEHTNVSLYAITCDGGSTSNYVFSYVSGTLTINPAALTITPNNQTKTVGTTFNFTGTEFTTSGLINGDTVTNVTLNSSGASAGAAVGTYDITGSEATGTGLGNYTITYNTGTLTVNGLVGEVVSSPVLNVRNIVIDNNGGTKNAGDFSFQVNNGSATAFEADGSNQLTLTPGTYTVTGVAMDGYETTYENCSDISLADGEEKTCVITNNDIAQSNNGGGGSGSGGFVPPSNPTPPADTGTPSGNPTGETNPGQVAGASTVSEEDTFTGNTRGTTVVQGAPAGTDETATPDEVTPDTTDNSGLDLNAAAAASLQNASGFQAFLDWLKEYWWGILILLILAALAYYFYGKKPKVS